jgi:phosphatidylserine/phosphatidylglycerophosphate/cardiolipin synthase-like enzyme
MIRIQGECVADWQTLFEQNWQRSGESLEKPRRCFTEGVESDAAGRVLKSRSMIHSEVTRSFIKQARGATDNIWVATAYFVPSRKIRRVLCKQARSGVDVRLLLPGPYSDHTWARHMGRRYYDRLLRHGVRVYEYQPRFMHMKILLSDRWVSIGSSNIDRWNFRWNLEANQEVRDVAFADIVRRQFEQDFSESHEIDFQQWRQRPFWVRLNIWGWSIVVRILSWFSFNRKK